MLMPAGPVDLLFRESLMASLVCSSVMCMRVVGRFLISLFVFLLFLFVLCGVGELFSKFFGFV